MRQPQEIRDVEHEQILERVAAVDVAKASGMVCLRVPQAGRLDRRRSLVWEVPATTTAVLELAEHLARERIQNGHLGGNQRRLADLVLPAGSGQAANPSRTSSTAGAPRRRVRLTPSAHPLELLGHHPGDGYRRSRQDQDRTGRTDRGS